MVKVVEISNEEADRMSQKGAKKSSVGETVSTVLAKASDYWWNFFDWTTIGAQFTGAL